MPVLQLRGEDIGGDRVTCTGPQIASVLEMLAASPELRGCCWYAGGLDAVSRPELGLAAALSGTDEPGGGRTSGVGPSGGAGSDRSGDPASALAPHCGPDARLILDLGPFIAEVRAPVRRR